MITFQATESDIDSPTHLEKEWLYLRNESIRKEVITEQKRLGKKMFIKILFLKKESCKSKIIFHGVFFFFFFLKMFLVFEKLTWRLRFASFFFQNKA